MSDRLQWVVVNPDQGIGAPMKWSCARIVSGQEAGDDPTGPWREMVERDQARAYGPQPPHIAATFVMQWYLDVVVNAAAASAGVSEYVLDVAPEALHFDLADDGHFPAAFSVRGTGARQIADVRERRDAARAAYESHACRFVDSYAPTGAKISSHQRRGMVVDLWEMAWERMAAYLPITSLPYRRRESCCMVYALPGGVECLACPRIVPRPVG